MFDITDVATYQAYFQNLATNNKLIESFSYGDQEDQNGEIITWDGVKLWLWPYGQAQVVDPGDNFMQQRQSSLFVGGPAPELIADRETFFNTCEKIVKQIIAHMIKDRDAGTLITRVNGWRFERAEILASTRLIGCELQFFFDDGTGFAFNENDWEE